MFDQHRSRLDPEVSLKRTLAPHGDSVVFQGRGRPRRGLGEALPLPLRAARDARGPPLGRRAGARGAVARLMLEPADLLLLDEPTNDLDIPTLEVLEESLLEFPGALVLVTHDRYLLDRVSTRLLALDGRGGAVPYADYDQWEEGRRRGGGGGGSRTARRPPAAAKPTGGRGGQAARSSATSSSASGTRWRRASSRPRQRARGLPRGGRRPGGRRRPPGPRRADRGPLGRAGRGRPPLRALGRARGEGEGLAAPARLVPAGLRDMQWPCRRARAPSVSSASRGSTSSCTGPGSWSRSTSSSGRTSTARRSGTWRSTWPSSRSSPCTSSATRWPAGRWAAPPTGSSSGRWAASPTSTRRSAPAPPCGASRPGRSSTSPSSPCSSA